MRERLDCALVFTSCNAHWARPDAYPMVAARLYLEPLCDTIDISKPDTIRVLSEHAMPLRRFDACLLTVSESNLAWARTLLAASQPDLDTPVLVLANGLKAAAINDLYALGVADFLRTPLCFEELRVRIERLLDRRRSGVPVKQAMTIVRDINPKAYPENGSPKARNADGDTQERAAAELEAFAVASASRYASSPESFRHAKGRVVDHFERAYITAALSRNSGNIAMAARAAQKHRRAFWELMRKHRIDATPFRPRRNTNTFVGG